MCGSVSEADKRRSRATTSKHVGRGQPEGASLLCVLGCQEGKQGSPEHTPRMRHLTWLPHDQQARSGYSTDRQRGTRRRHGSREHAISSATTTACDLEGGDNSWNSLFSIFGLRLTTNI